IIVNTGSLIAVLIIYRKDILRLLQNGTRYIITKDMQLKQDFNFIIYLLVATMITGIIGLLLEDFISSNLSSVTIVGFTLLITAIALWIIRNLKGYKNDEEITIKDAVIVGLAQAVALVPGISRSGATIVASIPSNIEATIVAPERLIPGTNDTAGAKPTITASLIVISSSFLKGYKNDEEITIKDAVIVGLAQAVALVPGISRSGATIVASMLLGMERDT